MARLVRIECPHCQKVFTQDLDKCERKRNLLDSDVSDRPVKESFTYVVLCNHCGARSGHDA